MPILAAVVHLDPHADHRLGALAAIAALPGLTIGERFGDRLPVVLDTPTRAADREAWETLGALPGVTHVDLVSVEFSDLLPHAPAPEGPSEVLP